VRAERGRRARLRMRERLESDEVVVRLRCGLEMAKGEVEVRTEGP